MPERICSECKAQYNSEYELRAHLGVAHRKFSLVQTSTRSSETPTSGSAIQSQAQRIEPSGLSGGGPVSAPGTVENETEEPNVFK